ncbi:PREDICTED: odorant receptor 13a-like [Wasmannia auropunctata]|uniref:odorant receptor 13a-like n=1 Tax=Wasmannia auropunctata TaxID=64793 RepID=UPI0005ED9704|nr:PREDICTED: odorant receptor 13a-like [Wasmannia auropunctata]
MTVGEHAFHDLLISRKNDIYVPPSTPFYFPDMNRKDEDDKSRGKDALSLEYYIKYLLLALGYARIWPTESFSPLKILLSWGATIVFISANFLLLFSEIVVLTMNNDLKLFANIIGVINMHFVGLMKWCYCIWRNKEIVDIVEQLKKCHVLCQRINDSKKGCQIYKNEMEHARKHSNFFVWWWTLVCIYGVLHWCSTPLLLEWAPDQINSINYTFKTRNLPFVGWYPLNTDNTYNYVCLYLMQVIGGLSSALGIVCYDTFYVSMLMVVCAQFQYINTILVTIDFANVPEAIFILESKLKNCVKCHSEIIKFLKMLQAFSGPIMFVQCIETLTILCLVSFEASVIKIAIDMESILKLWNLLEYFLCGAFQLYIFCFFATQLEHLGLQIAHSMYSCGWELIIFEKKGQIDFKTQLKQQRSVSQLIRISMVRAQRPIVLTGGPFYVLSLETFRVIMGMAISNSVILRTISDTGE